MFVDQNISREHAGRYECSANNGVGSAALAEISLTVLCKFYIKSSLCLDPLS